MFVFAENIQYTLVCIPHSVFHGQLYLAAFHSEHLISFYLARTLSCWIALMLSKSIRACMVNNAPQF